MKNMIIYRSMSGHSKKIARSIARELGVPAYDIKAGNIVLEDVDMLFIVGGIYAGACHAGTLKFVKAIKPGSVKRAALVTSSASDKVGQDGIRAALEANQIEVVGEYRCFGSFLFARAGHPNEKEVEDAVTFAKGMADGIPTKN